MFDYQPEYTNWLQLVSELMASQNKLFAGSKYGNIELKPEGKKSYTIRVGGRYIGAAGSEETLLARLLDEFENQELSGKERDSLKEKEAEKLTATCGGVLSEVLDEWEKSIEED